MTKVEILRNFHVPVEHLGETERVFNELAHWYNQRRPATPWAEVHSELLVNHLKSLGVRVRDNSVTPLDA